MYMYMYQVLKLTTGTSSGCCPKRHTHFFCLSARHPLTARLDTRLGLPPILTVLERLSPTLHDGTPGAH